MHFCAPWQGCVLLHPMCPTHLMRRMRLMRPCRCGTVLELEDSDLEPLRGQLMQLSLHKKLDLVASGVMRCKAELSNTFQCAHVLDRLCIIGGQDIVGQLGLLCCAMLWGTLLSCTGNIPEPNLALHDLSLALPSFHRPLSGPAARVADGAAQQGPWRQSCGSETCAIREQEQSVAHSASAPWPVFFLRLIPI